VANINELIGADVDDLVHKSDLNAFLKDNINNLSDDDENNQLLTKNDILNLPDSTPTDLKLLIKKDVLNTPSSENKINYHAIRHS
jgi:hypothetical protein